MRRLVPALAAGGLLALAFPGVGQWWLAPIAVAILTLATRGATLRLGAAVGLVAGLAFFTPTLSWSGSYLGVLPWAALAVCQALYAAILGLLCARLQRDGRVHPVGVALAWLAQEALRSRTPYGGFPWVRLAFSQADSPLARLASIAGAPGVSFAVALAGGLLAAGALAAYRRRGLRPVARPAGAASLIVVAGLLVPVPTDGPTVRVLAVQGNVPRPGLDFNAERRRVLDNHVQETLDGLAAIRASGRTAPEVVLWPENASDIDPIDNADAAAAIARATDAAGVAMVVGGLRETRTTLSNVSWLWEPSLGPTAAYVKQHPVPFAEYIPDRAFWRIFSSEVDLLRRDISPGDGPVLFDVRSSAAGTVHIGPSICFEVAYDDLVRRNVELGANLLLVQTNNATFGFTAESAQQLAISRLRAIEHGRAVVHISTVGVSALILPDGTALSPTALFTPAALEASLPVREGRTLATMVGAWPEYAGLLALVVLLLLPSRAARPDRQSRPRKEVVPR